MGSSSSRPDSLPAAKACSRQEQQLKRKACQHPQHHLLLLPEFQLLQVPGKQELRCKAGLALQAMLSKHVYTNKAEW
jgi:hypothetical protein